jgi:16S rRNA (cytosine1402-N4)-methyltransferase
MDTAKHIPVLLNETIKYLDIQERDVVIDGTLGAGGHSNAICSLLGKNGILIGIDQDSDAIENAKKILDKHQCRVIFKNESFRDIDKILDEVGIDKVNKILLDIGFSSDQVENSKRGFSFKQKEPLLMTLSNNITEDTLTAEEIVNTWDEENIADIIFGYGEEKFSRRIAKGIIDARDKSPIKDTLELADIIKESVPAWYRKRKIHPATKTFQALRIVVNDEIGALKDGLEVGVKSLKKGGVISVISFHSIEDRIVKNFFKRIKNEGIGEIVTKKPISPDKDELLNNKRARSAKLRVFKKTI